jgi:hypothetical protein
MQLPYNHDHNKIKNNWSVIGVQIHISLLNDVDNV